MSLKNLKPISWLFMLLFLFAFLLILTEASMSFEPNEIHQFTNLSSNYVVINSNGLEPATMTIEVGDAVSWQNITSESKTLISGFPGLGNDFNIYLPMIVKPSTTTNRNDFASPFSILNLSGSQAVNFSTSLDTDDNFTYTFTITGTHYYYVDEDKTIVGSITVEPASAPTIEETSPTNNESGVALTRETIIKFNKPVNPSSVTSAAIYAESSGQPLAGSLHVSPDGKRITLFYDQALPDEASVIVTIDGDQLSSADGSPIDANQNGQAGGVATITFQTLSITPNPGTSVCGRVLASELDPNGFNQGLENVTITVDGAENTLKTTTDADGDFCLDPAPASRFFVHVDGRTAVNSVPAGEYYPFVGKAWEPVAGQTTNIGIVHLPLVPAGALQTVSQSQQTEVKFVPAIINENPNFANVAVTVPADSLFADDGTRSGKVGIAPVPPDRLPGKLPPGLDFPLVITVQTDGATNFDIPAQACFPNLPDPNSNETLNPGDKSALWSFNHDIGRFEVIGPMTVTSDGTLVCSDPGVGIEAPGWHAASPFSPLTKLWNWVKEQCPSIGTDACTSAFSLGVFDCATSFIPVKSCTIEMAAAAIRNEDFIKPESLAIVEELT